MEVYQLHQRGGEYEDRYDYIVATYLREQDAEKHQQKLLAEQQEKIRQRDFCGNCPVSEMSKRQWNSRKDEITEYCKNAQIDYEGNSVWCDNRVSYWWDEYEESYYVEEIDVVECVEENLI